MSKNHPSRIQPPHWADFILERLFTPDSLEEIQGDLHEEFYYKVRTVGERRARLDYIRNVLGFTRTYAVKRNVLNFPSSPIINSGMIIHNVTIAFRQLIRQKSFSAINISGLALAMTCCLLIFLWIRDERSIDNFHINGQNLYSVYQTYYTKDHIQGGYATPDDLVTEIKQTIPEVQYATSYITGYELPWGHPETFQVDDKIYKLEGSRASSDFFKMFSYKLIEGSPETALNDKFSLAISRKMAILFFGNPQNAIGKSIRFENRTDLFVTAIFENLPSESSFKFDYLLNWEAYQADIWNLRASSNTRTIIQLRPDTNTEALERKIRQFLNIRLPENVNYRIELGLQRFGDGYLYSNFTNGKPSSGRIEYIKIFSGVALFILLIACINFMNLSTAQAIKRAKEIGVRKVLGSSRINLIKQFFGESFLNSILALVLALFLVHLLLPSFNDISGKQMETSLNLTNWVILLFIPLFTGIIAGSYPAFFLSSMKPVRILKGTYRFAGSAIGFRKGLVVFQFILSIVLLISTFIISRQTNYIQQKNLGYDREQLIYIKLEGELILKYQVFKQEVLKQPGIKYVDRSSETPHSMGFGVSEPINWESKDSDMKVVFNPTSVGYDFIKLMEIEIVEGRDFSQDRKTDSTAFLINQEAVKQMGIIDPIGKWISAWGKKGSIIGIIKDYHTHSLHEPIIPLIVDVKEDLEFGTILIKTETEKVKEVLASLETVYKSINPNYPFMYSFADQEYNRMYRNEEVTTKLSKAFAIIAGIISCLGLFGLTIFSVEQRTKEIGIRKVLGATVGSILSLISKDFLRLILIAFVIGIPIAGFIMSYWLESFAYRIPIGWWIFAFSGILALIIAMLTISFQALKAALANPVNTLRTE